MINQEVNFCDIPILFLDVESFLWKILYFSNLVFINFNVNLFKLCYYSNIQCKLFQIYSHDNYFLDVNQWHALIVFPFFYNYWYMYIMITLLNDLYPPRTCSLSLVAAVMVPDTCNLYSKCFITELPTSALILFICSHYLLAGIIQFHSPIVVSSLNVR